MAVEFSLAKNGEETCSLNGLFFHSGYNPQREGAAFVQEISADFHPSVIIVISPALGYCAQPLRQRFPGAKLVAMEFTEEFSKVKSLFDEYFVINGENSREVCQKIFFSLGEEKIFLSLPVVWGPSGKIFAEKIQAFIPHLRQLYEMTKTAVATRANFTEVWLKNSFKFFMNVKRVILPQKTDLPVLIVASGVTLEKSLEEIRRYEKSFFVIALSSAVEVLLTNGIRPDLIFTTDGGFWAKMHLNPKIILEKQIPVAMSCEAAVFGDLRDKGMILPLNYGDDCCELFETTDFPHVRALRNGTVSGTALDFALKVSSASVFICGLDLSEENYRGKNGVPSHALPNILEAQNQMGDNRLQPLSTRLYASSVGSGLSLEIYAQWFDGLGEREKSRIVRIKSGKDKFFRHIPNIKEENWEDFGKKPFGSNGEKGNLFSSPQKIDRKKVIQGLWDFLKKGEGAFLKAEQGMELTEEEMRRLSSVDYGLSLQLKKSGTKSDGTPRGKSLIGKLKRETEKF